MAESASWEVSAKLQGYLLGVVTIVEFQKWFGPVAWRLARDQAADQLVRGVQQRLAEYKRGDWTEPQLRSRLTELLARAMEES